MRDTVVVAVAACTLDPRDPTNSAAATTINDAANGLRPRHLRRDADGAELSMTDHPQWNRDYSYNVITRGPFLWFTPPPYLMF